MSLLMDALKKAEETKQRQAGEHHTVPPGVSTPVTPGANAAAHADNSPLPDLSLHSDMVDADLASVSATPRTTHTGSVAQDAPGKAAARGVFAAKTPTRSPRGLWVLVGLGALAAVGVGGYFWWQLQNIPQQNLARPAPSPAVAKTMPTVAPPASGEADKASPASTPALAASPRGKDTTSVVQPLPQVAHASPARNKTEPRAPKPSAEHGAHSPASPASAVALSRTSPRAQPAVEQAYASLQAGNLAAARRDYEQVLRSDARNVDALLGLAAIAAREGHAEQAHEYYLRALEADPNDATAQAGFINTRSHADPEQAESRLKTALARRPDSAALHLALGNLYARQNRWGEAQQAYFQVYAAEPGNPDSLFNLAVSLDHLHQDKLAIQYYQMALDVGANRPAMFNREQAQQRLTELRP